MNIYKYNSKKLIELRKKRGLTRSALGNLVGRDEIYILSLEEGEELIRILNVLQFCKVLKVNPTSFYDEFTCKSPKM